MTYFPDRGGDQPYRQLFLEPVTDDPVEDDGAEEPARSGEWNFTDRELREAAAETAWRDVEDADEREQLLARRDFFRASVWVRDLVLVILFTLASLLLIWVIAEMISGAARELQQNFSVLRNLSGRAPGWTEALHG